MSVKRHSNHILKKTFSKKNGWGTLLAWRFILYHITTMSNLATLSTVKQRGHAKKIERMVKTEVEEAALHRLLVSQNIGFAISHNAPGMHLSLHHDVNKNYLESSLWSHRLHRTNVFKLRWKVLWRSKRPCFETFLQKHTGDITDTILMFVYRLP